MKKAYLFKIRLWQYNPPEYLLVYAEDEVAARQLGSEQVVYNNRSKVLPKDLILVTYGL